MVCPTKNNIIICGSITENDKGCKVDCFPVCSSIGDPKDLTPLAINKKTNMLAEMPAGQTLAPGQGNAQFRSITASDSYLLRSINWTAFMGNDGICHVVPANNQNAASAWYLFRKKSAQPTPSDTPPAASSPIQDKADEIKKGADKLTDDARNGLQQMLNRLGTPGTVATLAAATVLVVIGIVAGAKGVSRFGGWLSGLFGSKSNKTTDKATEQPIRTPPSRGRAPWAPPLSESNPSDWSERPSVPVTPRNAIPPPSRIPSSPLSRRPSVDPLSKPSQPSEGVPVIVHKDSNEDTPIAWNLRPSRRLIEILKGFEQGKNSALLRSYESKYNVRVSQSIVKMAGLFVEVYCMPTNESLLPQTVLDIIEGAAKQAGKRSKPGSMRVAMEINDLMDAMDAMKLMSFNRPSAGALLASNAPWFEMKGYDYPGSDTRLDRVTVLQEAQTFLDANYRDTISDDNRIKMANAIADGVEAYPELADMFVERGGVSNELMQLSARVSNATSNGGGMMETMRTNGTMDTMRPAENKSAEEQRRLERDRDTLVDEAKKR